jgi:uncharacterized membrane protein YqjE
MNWFQQALTGPDNETVAIGRLIGMGIAVVLLILLPVTAAATTVCHFVPVSEWSALLTALALYVVPVSGSIWGIIWGTNGTEPKPKDKTDA